ncbi:MAG: hypothetical protein K0U72_06635 [Gammaproteobacteria bacterium]|nr:hypothetical protein [Gammaproteobacteria bacterium]
MEKKNGESDGDVTVEFEFRTIEILYGRAASTFKLHGYSKGENPFPVGDFDGHTDPAFWAESSSNTGTTTLCSIFGVFEVGETYLLIATEEPDFRAFENIQSNDDLWLKVIRLLVERTVPTADGV